jgi:hypothetical protein
MLIHPAFVRMVLPIILEYNGWISNLNTAAPGTVLQPLNWPLRVRRIPPIIRIAVWQACLALLFGAPGSVARWVTCAPKR